MQYDMSDTLRALAALPPEPPRPVERGVWGVVSAVPRGIVEAGAQVAASAVQVGEGVRQFRDTPHQDIPGMGLPDSETAEDVRAWGREFRPDPVTAGAAERVLYQFGRVGAKMIGGALAAGPWGVGVMAAEEGLTQTQELTRQGVKPETAQTVGIVQAGAMALGGLPAYGRTLLGTAGLYALGGPGGYLAQSALSQQVLERANYADLARQYEFDATGFWLSALLPAPFAAYGAARALRAGKAAKPAASAEPRPAPTVQPELPLEPVPRQAVDAAMVHNLTLLDEYNQARSAARPQSELPRDAPAYVNDPGHVAAMARYFDAHGVPVNDDGTVTLWHATTAKLAAEIESSGYVKGGSTAAGGMTGLDLQPSAFFGANREWVTSTWGNGLDGLVEVRVPVQFLRHPAQNFNEFYFEGGLRRSGDIWVPERLRSTFVDRLVERKRASNQAAARPPAELPLEPVPRQAVDAAMVHNLTLVDEYAQARAKAPPAGDSVITERGLEVPVRWRLVEADELVTSHTDDLAANRAYPEALQPRDRSRAASQEQIARIENAIRPELLGDSVKASDGAPIVGADMVVESGNARAIALRRAYQSGKAEDYKAWVVENAARFGIDSEQAAGMRRPVLVRENVGAVDRAEFARQANESAIAAMSPSERARADAARLTDLEGLVANDDGKISSAASAGFLRRFIQEVVAPTERGEMLQADGRLSAAGQQRVLNAIFAKAYGDPALLQALTESTDSNVRNILAGLVRAAPEVARLRDLIEAGARNPVDLASDVARAVQEFGRLRELGMTVQQHLAQGDMLGGGLTDAQNNLLLGLAENARAPKRIAEMLRQLVQAVDEAGDPRQGSLLGDAPPSAADVAADAVERMRSISDAQLSDTPPETIQAKAETVTTDVARRAEAAEMTNPDLIVRIREDGSPITVAEELSLARKLAAEGTDVELGALDADLVRVAIDCALSSGA